MGDFLALTSSLSQADTGAFIRLLCHQWSQGSVPTQIEKLERIAGGTVSEDVLALFETSNSGELRCNKVSIVRLAGLIDISRQVKATPSTRFIKPSLSELDLHAAKIGLPQSEVERFSNYYESNGWRVGRNPMKSWQAAMVNWRKNYEERRTNTSAGHNGSRVTAHEQRQIDCDPSRNGAKPHDLDSPLPFA